MREAPGRRKSRYDLDFCGRVRTAGDGCGHALAPEWHQMLSGLRCGQHGAFTYTRPMQRAIKLQVNVGKDHLVRLPSEFPEGPAEVIVIAAGHLPFASVPHRGQGMDSERYARGEFFVADDFDAPLSAEIQRDFEGSGDDPL